ncbi:MAG TPA: MMPL family transporter, partial [Thermomicrobiales bacterium]|nr:MMPL family transporter [Thermomicrobiales bacterium]
RFMDIASFTPTIAAMVGLGVGVDYALFIVTRYRESVHSGMSVNRSVAKSMDTSGRAVMFAGIVVVIAMLGLVAIGLPFITAYAIAASLVISLTIISALTLLPALLALTGKRIDKWGIKRFQVTAADVNDTVGAKLGRRIQKTPWAFAICSAAFLMVLALPVFSVKLGFNDAGANPPSTHTRRAYDLLEKGFGPGFNAPFLIAIEKSGGLDPAMLDTLETQLKATEGVVFVAPPTLNEAGDTAVITIIPAYRLTDSKAADLVDTIRDDILPPLTAGTGANAHVGGITASFIDVVEVMVSRTPYFFLIVVGLSFLLLATVFRSIAIAIKAAVMNLLSIGAAFGVIVAAFQWGWLKPVLGGSDGQPIIAFMPMFLFSILFGLSMDYEVFLLSRIREAWVHGKSTPDAVVEGLGVTARVITAAAAIMIVVFLSFVFIPDPITRQFGVGLATAIFLDATIVRLILVPATMELLGDWNWWFPSWLDRILPRINVEGSAHDVSLEGAAAD